MISRNGVQPFTASYAYDINSNRTQKVETIAGVTETINYAYNANDQLTTEVSSVNGTTSYQYDTNGSLTTKENSGKFSYQYGYDLRSRLATAVISRKEGLQNVTIEAQYVYNTNGIRTQALQMINSIAQNRYFLLDRGHTGYDQVFEESSSLGGSPARSYVIGDDVLSQNASGVSNHLLYDGHGSTRMLTDAIGTITEQYNYDAYGKMLNGDPNVTDKQSQTDLLYSGEQFDPGLQMQYLRARYYDVNTGRFNRLDPFMGNNDDPQSLHKYVYGHEDPVNNIDPSGESIIGWLTVAAVVITAFTLFNSCMDTGGSVAKTNSPKKITFIVDFSWPMGASQMRMWGNFGILSYVNKLRKAGHYVELVQYADEDRMVYFMNNRDIVIIFCHGPDAKPSTDNKIPTFSGFSLHGSRLLKQDVDDYEFKDHHRHWITANELKGRVNNTNLEVVAVACNSAQSNTMYNAIKPRAYIGLGYGTQPIYLKLMMQYVTDRLNGLSVEDAANNVRTEVIRTQITPVTQ